MNGEVQKSPVKEVLGVKIDDVSMDAALEIISSWVQSKKNGQIVVTPGPEFLVTASKDDEFRRVLSQADLSVPDGVGLRFAGVKHTVHGLDLMLKLCEMASSRGWKIGLLGGLKGVAKLCASQLKVLYPEVEIEFAFDGQEADEVVARPALLRKSHVDLLFVALGHPKQEQLLDSLKKENVNFGVGMGVGGSFDLIAKIFPHPPEIFQRAQLTWLWRLLTKPGHLRRVVKATIVFPLLIAKKKFFFFLEKD